jgi:NADH dehydrogenase
MSAQRKIITVFGGTGFLGRHIIYALARTGAQIRVATRLPQSAYFLRPSGDVGQIVPYNCNVHDGAAVANALRGATHAVNLIGALYEQGKNGTFDKLHHLVPKRIAEQAGEASLESFVHISALGASTQSASTYSRTKALGENAVTQTFARSVVLRPSVVFGPEDDFFNRFAAMARFSPFLPVVGSGETKFQPVYVGDIAKAVKTIITAAYPQKHAGLTYELGGPETLSFRDCLHRMLAVTGQDARVLSLPVPLAQLVAIFGSVLPKPPLTRDQIKNLQTDNVLSGHYPVLEDLGITPTALGAILPSYLNQYKKTG